MKAVQLHSAHAGAIYAIAPLGDGAVLSGGSDGMVFAWDRERPDEVRAVAKAPSPVLAILPHGDLLHIGTSAGELIIIDLGAKRPAQQVLAHGKGIYAITGVGQDHFACAGGDGVLSIWDRTGSTGYTRQRMIPMCDAKLRGLATSTSNDHLAVACGDGTVRVLDTTRYNEVATFAGHSGGANTVAFHPSRSALVSGGKDGYLRVWDLRSDHREVMAIAAHRSTIYGIAFDVQGLLCASVSRDKTVKLWDATTLDPIARGTAHSHSVNALCWQAGELFTGGDDRRLIRWTHS